MEETKEVKEIINEYAKQVNEKIRILSTHATYLIKNKSKDESLIEFTIDNILDTCVFEKGYQLFDKLCSYYETVNKEKALEYRNIYKELFLNEDDKVKTKH